MGDLNRLTYIVSNVEGSGDCLLCSVALRQGYIDEVVFDITVPANSAGYNG
jgi:hypothetical protein